MFSFFSSFGASSNFEKYRLILTTKNYQAPDQTSLKKKSLKRSEVKMRKHDRRQGSLQQQKSYIHQTPMKTGFTSLKISSFLIVQENCFLQQISTLNLKPIESYHQKNQAAKALNSQNILKSYWTLIQYKSSLLSQKSYPKGLDNLQAPSGHKCNNSFSKTSTYSSQSKGKKQSDGLSISPNQSFCENQRSILSVLRSQKQQFLKTLSVHQIYKQSVQLQRLFELIFRVIASIEPNISRFRQKMSFFTGFDGQQFDKKPKSSKEIDISSIQKLRAKNEDNGLLQNLLPVSSMPDVLRTNNEYNQKYKSARQQFFDSKLINYIHLQLLYKLLSAYSNQLICIRTFIANLMQQTNPLAVNSSLVESIKNMKIFQSQIITEKQVILWKKLITNYLICSQKIITYVEAHKSIKGFELINYQQLSPFQNVNIISLLDGYIDHKNTLQEPDIVKVQDLGMIMDINNHIKVQRKAQWSYQKALTARKMVFPSRNLKDKNNAFGNWHNSYSSNFPPKQVLTIDLLMEIRQNPHNPATQVSSQDDDDQSIYQPFLVNRHSCIYNFRESNISAASQFEFIPLQEMRKKQEQKFQAIGKKNQKNFYYFRSGEKDKEFKNIYSSSSKQLGSIWVK